MRTPRWLEWAALVVLCLGVAGLLVIGSQRSGPPRPGGAAEASASATASGGVDATSITNSSSAPAPSRTSPGPGPGRPVSSTSATGSFAPKFLALVPPVNLASYARSLPVQSAANICAVTQSGCADLVTAASPSCTFPPYPGPLAGVTGVGWAMWQRAPGDCVYAMGVSTG